MQTKIESTVLFDLAEAVIVEALGSADLTPERVAAALGVSRATLYRVFAPRGGVMTHVWAMRLQAVRAALDQPIERRTLSQLGTALGFGSASHLSRRFRARFGSAPRDWRAERMARARGTSRADVEHLNACWSALGR